MTAGIFSGVQTLLPVNHRCYQTTLFSQMFSKVWIMVTHSCWKMLTTPEWPPAKWQLPFIHFLSKCWSKRRPLQRLCHPEWDTLNYPWQKKQDENVSWITKEKKQTTTQKSHFRGFLLHMLVDQSASPLELWSPDGKRSNDWQSHQGPN